MRVAVDTNVLAYAEGVNDEERRVEAVSLLRGLNAEICIPAQVLGELFNVLLSRSRLSREDARDAVAAWRRGYFIAPTTSEVIDRAFALASDHKLSVWDAVIASAAVEAECALLLSEDLQHGFVWRGLTVVNPFAATMHPLLASVLR